MDLKSTYLKSKSSNSVISKKSKEDTSKRYNKQTRSNANFPRHGLKKRGVYVEKRLTKSNWVNNGKQVDSITQKPPPRPRPGQKKFLASVLTILSKSTTGTQYPEIDEDTNSEKDKNKAFLKQKNANNEDGAYKKVRESKNTTEKFKSSVLNKKFVREDKKKLVVLQSKKEVVQTPSNYSEWSYKDASQNSNVSNLIIYEDSNNKGGLNIADELKNAVLEGRNSKAKKLRYQENEPKTLVSEGPKVQKNLYNFFVDLLETTISVYNVTAEYDGTGRSNISKTNLQINESVASKLNVGKVKKRIEFDDGIISSKYLNYVQNDPGVERNYANIKTKPIGIKPYKREVPTKTAKVRQMKDSFLYPNNAEKMQKSKSVEINRKTTLRNKNDLINILKQELEIDTNTYEEPRSIFQALRVMARNKKKISFDPSIDYKTFTDECVLKRRKVISSRKVKKSSKDGATKNITRPARVMSNNKDYVHNSKKSYSVIDTISDSEINGTESYRSLEVYGFDYEPKPSYKSQFSKTTDLTFTYHSSPSNSDLDGNKEDVILSPTTTFSSIRKFSVR